MSPNFSPGARLGRYEIKTQLGAGQQRYFKNLRRNTQMANRMLPRSRRFTLVSETQIRSFAWLNKALADRSSLLVDLRVEFHFASLHDEPGYKDLLERMGLPISN